MTSKGTLDVGLVKKYCTVIGSRSPWERHGLLFTKTMLQFNISYRDGIGGWPVKASNRRLLLSRVGYLHVM